MLVQQHSNIHIWSCMLVQQHSNIHMRSCMLVQQQHTYSTAVWHLHKGYPDKGHPPSLSMDYIYSTVMLPALYGHNLMSTVHQRSCSQSWLQTSDKSLARAHSWTPAGTVLPQRGSTVSVLHQWLLHKLTTTHVQGAVICKSFSAGIKLTSCPKCLG